MKKILCLVLALSLLAGLLGACGNQESAQEPTDEQYKLEDSIFDDDNSGSAQKVPARPGEGNQDQVQFNPTQPTTGQQNTTGSSTEGEQATEPTTPPSDDTAKLSAEYEAFRAMTGAEKKAYQNSFETIDAFFEWYNAAMEAYNKEHPPTEIGSDGTINMDGLTGK